MRCLVDVNVVVALLAVNHQFHRAALAWYQTCGVGDAGICRLSWLGTIRVLGLPAVMQKDVLTTRQALDTVEQLITDERWSFLNEPPGIEDSLRSHFTYLVPTHRMVSDAYLAAFATCSGRQLVTLDQGFSQYKSLQVQILGG